MSKTRVETRTQVDVPPRHLFAFFVPQRMGYWYGPEMQTQFETSDGAAEFGVAQKVRIVGRIRSKEFSHTAVVTECQWGKKLEWRFEDQTGLRGAERWDFDPIESGGAGATLLRMSSEYEPSGFTERAVNWILTRHSVARRNREYLARLKRIAERDS